jgi:hypothetical protein
VPADVAGAVLKLRSSWSVEHAGSWQGGVWRNADDDLLLEACHEDSRVLVSRAIGLLARAIVRAGQGRRVWKNAWVTLQ